MGSYDRECPACGEIFFGGYNSCRNRHCPSCSGPTRAHWFARVQQDVLPVLYFHLIFTLPGLLSQLMLANRKKLYGLLFRKAWATIKKLAADKKHLGGKTGATMVLHTWSQMLDHHPHVHCVVPGGAVSPDGTWIESRSPKFLFHYEVVSEIFQGKFVAGLKRLHAKGQLRLDGKLSHLADRQAFEQWLNRLCKHKWVVHVQKAPDGCDGPDAVLKYLARYVAGTAISDKRLISDEAGRVYFWIKDRKRRNKRVRRSLPGVEFTRRFLLHVLPPGFQRVRYFGWFSNPQRKQQVPQVRELLAARADSSASAAAEVLPPEPDGLCDRDRCPACGQGPLTKVEKADAPSSWHAVLIASSYATSNDHAWHGPTKPAGSAPTVPSYLDTS
jgi:hypothetical protein